MTEEQILIALKAISEFQKNTNNSLLNILERLETVERELIYLQSDVEWLKD